MENDTRRKGKANRRKGGRENKGNKDQRDDTASYPAELLINKHSLASAPAVNETQPVARQASAL